jgi:copper chaperone for superoxide dismutase
LSVQFFFSKLEFEVKDLKNDGDIEKLKSNLLQKKGITSIQTVVNENESKIFVETTLPSAVVQKQIERETNTIAILRGMGTSNWTREKYLTSAAVSIISNFDELLKPIRGVVRFVQLDDSHCAIDGTIDGLKSGHHSINICEFGDISKGCER